MNNKRYTIICALLAVLFALTSCGELGELWDFVLPAETSDLTFHREPDVMDTPSLAMPGILMGERHRETLGEPYTPAEIGDPTGYVRTAYLPGADKTAAETALSSLGVKFSVVEQLHPTAAGTVYGVEYAGATLAAEHYINPGVPVTLYVSAPKPVYPERTVENTVYITFDDGPTAEGTEEILDILDTYGIKGTFFLIGREVEKAPEAAKAIYNRGHDIACHSMTHNYDYIYASAENLMTEVDSWTWMMEELGVDFTTTAKLFRYPGGSGTPSGKGKKAEMDRMLRERGFLSFDWNIVSNDALLFQCPAGMTAYDYIKETFRTTFQDVKDSTAPKILLLHETVAETRVVLPWIIEYLIGEGCAFAPLSEFISDPTLTGQSEAMIE